VNEPYDRFAIAPDREFEARLKTELDARLGVRQQSANHYTEENEPMSIEPDVTHRGRRWVLLVAASLIALIGVGAVAAVAARDDSTPGPSVADEPTVAPTTTTVTPSTTAAPTTTIPPLSDAEIAEAVILLNDEYNDPEVRYPQFRKQNLSLPAKMDADVARQFPECAPYLGTVFESSARPAVTADATFEGFGYPAAMVEYVVVHPDETQAAAMLDAMQEPAFVSQCAPAYVSSLSDRCCDDVEAWFPVIVGGTEKEPPVLDVDVDDIWIRAYDGTWTDEEGVVHGPEGFVWAAVRVGRVVASIEAMTTTDDGSSVTTNEQFERMVARMVERAASAQNGIAL
jgi:hypothetical protein